MVKQHTHTTHPDTWLAHIAQSRPAEDIALLQFAIQLNKNTEPAVLNRGLQIADILFSMDLDSKTLAAALMYPAFKRHEISSEHIADHFGESIRSLLIDTMQMQSLEKLRDFPLRANQQIENMRKLLLAMVTDIRAVLIILAERIIQLREAKNMEITDQKKLAQKTMSIYAPLANRIGIWQLKWEIEDLCFRYLEPETYKQIASLLSSKRDVREKYIKETIQTLTSILNANHLSNFKVTGRVKHIYSIYSKMLRKGSSFDEIHDITALRVLVPEVADCYNVLSILQNTWKQIPQEFDDYISQPKPNGYRSLHTLVIGPENQVIEVQIRTYQMHQDSELGVAAHWQYKEGSLDASQYEAKIALLRQIMAWQNELANENADQSKGPIKDIFADRIYVFTPLGDIIDLPQGATSLDFAYHIHSEIGHRCRGAKVDGKMAPLTYQLKTGQRVEVLTNKQHNPSRDWLNPHYGYIKTSKARAHLQHWFRTKDALEKTHAEKEQAEKLHVKPKPKERLHSSQHELHHLKKRSVLNVSNLLTKVARCCKPLPGDEIIGYITQKSGLSIHRVNCSNLQHLKGNEKERFIEIDLGEKIIGSYPVDIEVRAIRQQHTLRDITAALADIHIHVAGFQTYPTDDENEVSIVLTLTIPHISELTKAMNTLRHLPAIVSVHRM